MSKPKRKTNMNNGGEDSYANGADAHDEWELSAELEQVESRLLGLRPRDDCLDRDQLIFLAGRESVLNEGRPSSGGATQDAGQWPNSNLIWPGSFAGMTAVAAVLLVTLLTRTSDVAGPMTEADESESVATASVSPVESQISRLPSRDKLSSAPFHVRTIDQWLFSDAISLPPEVESAPPGAAIELKNEKILTPRSMGILRNELST